MNGTAFHRTSNCWIVLALLFAILPVGLPALLCRAGRPTGKIAKSNASTIQQLLVRWKAVPFIKAPVRPARRNPLLSGELAYAFEYLQGFWRPIGLREFRNHLRLLRPRQRQERKTRAAEGEERAASNCAEA